MSAPDVGASAADFLRSVPLEVTVDGETLLVGDGESDHLVRRDGDALSVEWVLRGVPRETVAVTAGGHVLDTLLVLAHANTWRGRHHLPLLDLWGRAAGSPSGFAVHEARSGWTVVDASDRLLAWGMQRPYAGRLARALAHTVDELVEAVTEPDGGFYSFVPLETRPG